MPIVMSMSKVLHSTPLRNPAIGQFLILCGTHANLLISSLFLTATVANPLVSDHAEDILGIDFDFDDWFIGGVVPCALLALILPPFFAWFSGAATQYQSDEVQKDARRELDAMGPMSVKEWQLVGVLGMCLVLWVTNDQTDLPETFVALLGLCVLLCLGTMEWADIVDNGKGKQLCNFFLYRRLWFPWNLPIVFATYSAWDSFFWLSGMVLMAEQLSALGLTKWFGNWCARLLVKSGITPLGSAMCLALMYFFSMVSPTLYSVNMSAE
jgi:DASS family divalent anion:Na+ symporter